MKCMLFVVLAANQLITSYVWSWPGMSKQFCENVPNNTLPMCQRKLIRYFFNETIKRCQEFIITNCFESGDYFFPSMGYCIQHCRPNQTRGKCWHKPNRGSGSKNLTRWYYDDEENQCYLFFYRGENGNGNNFQHREKCIDTCRYPTMYFQQKKKEIKDLIKAYKKRKEEENKKKKAQNATLVAESIINDETIKLSTT
ncbi:LOW QUALITY PROTEIN: kunitz-type serine protease inhibitor A-like [Ixodes scapularis]|uniref:LOW QUALITY PROTEIN: kunitz-type serine protease inhibitor A-like n=1 Tax=Ixodes scapularis TaxID=6945 RepID=UPI001C38C7EF|nr:LOW QUALITY PROTEIN: kunitz-type serine protease inhibitor A-like [Ixodes scapularis]